MGILSKLTKKVGETKETALHYANINNSDFAKTNNPNNPQLHTAKLQPLLPNLPLFKSRIYLSHRSYLVRIPTQVARKQGFEGGEVVIFAIARKVSDY